MRPSRSLLQPLLARRNELDKLRKEVKEQWQREQRKMVGVFSSGDPDPGLTPLESRLRCVAGVD